MSSLRPSGRSMIIRQPVTAHIGPSDTTIQRPLLNIPTIVLPGQSFEISCVADPATTGWSAELRHGTTVVPLTVTGASYDASTLWWTMDAELPGSLLHELYDLEQDPHEVRTLAYNARHATLLKEMKDKLKDFQKRTKDPWIVKWQYE